MSRLPSVCNEPGCPNVSDGPYCPVHARTSTRNHRGVARQARGYDADYERRRRELLGLPCRWCGAPDTPDMEDAVAAELVADWDGRRTFLLYRRERLLSVVVAYRKAHEAS